MQDTGWSFVSVRQCICKSVLCAALMQIKSSFGLRYCPCGVAELVNVQNPYTHSIPHMLCYPSNSKTVCESIVPIRPTLQLASALKQTTQHGLSGLAPLA